jgi:hypothetical protein
LKEKPMGHTTLDERIRERAYHLWEQEGRPHGRDVEYWERARELVAMEESAGAGLLPNPMSHPLMQTGQPAGVEEAEIQDNLGETPGRLTDQGDRPQTPKARAGSHAGSAAPRASNGKPGKSGKPKRTATK